jgi:hypothetical protein
LKDFGVAVGRKPLAPDYNTPQHVDGLSSSAGRTQIHHEFSARLMEVCHNLRVEAALPTSLQPPPPSEKTLDWQRRPVCVHQDGNATPVLPTSVMCQEWKRDVAMHSFRNVPAQAASVIFHHTHLCTVWKGIVDSSPSNKWMLADSEYANKPSKEERQIFGPHSVGSFNDANARWCDEIVTLEACPSIFTHLWQFG